MTKKTNKITTKNILIVNLIVIIIILFFYFFHSFNLIENIQGKNVCEKIAKEFNKTKTISFIISNNEVITPVISNAEQAIIIDSEHTSYKNNKNNFIHICKFWIKEKKLHKRPYMKISAEFNFFDKHFAEIKYTKRKIEETIKPNEVISIEFDYDATEIKEAKNIVFSYKTLFLPITKEEACEKVSILQKEAKEVYNYKYDDVLICNCDKRYTVNDDKCYELKNKSRIDCFLHTKLVPNSKCDIFNNENIKENCMLLNELLPICNQK